MKKVQKLIYLSALIILTLITGCVANPANEDVLKHIANGEGKVLETLYFYSGGSYSQGIFVICDNSGFVTGIKITYDSDGGVLIDKTPLFITSTEQIKCSCR